MRRERGFTLVELLIAMTMFIFVIASVASVFAPLLTQFKQQSKSAETQIEGIIGLEMLRRDIKHAGFGLPWVMDGATYDEADDDGLTDWVDSDFNDGPANPPGAIRSDRGGSDTLGGTTQYDSDVLVLKAANVAINGASQKWTLLGEGDVKRNGPIGEGDPFENLSGDAFDNSDRVIVISPGNSDKTRHRLVRPNGGNSVSWKTPYNATLNFTPVSPDFNIIYGISADVDMRFPFNRTEYYIRIPGTMPNQCAGGTGVLYKSDLNHSSGTHAGGENPVLDCVADLQVVYTANIPGVGITPVDEFYTNTLTAREIREQIRTVTVYILAQEGQKDTNFTYELPVYSPPAANASSVRVGPIDSTSVGRDFDFEANGIVDWQNYRWKVYTITVTMENLG